MKLGLFNGGRLGLVDREDVLDISGVVPVSDDRGRLAALIESGAAAVTEQVVGDAPRHRLADVRWEAPLPRPGKIIGAPANYYEHVEEMPNSATIREWGFFLKANTSVIGDGGTVKLPYSDMRTDYEGEVAVVIGRRGRNIPLDRALDHVFGYSCVLDMTVRSTEDRSARKSFDTFAPLGPTVVTADEMPGPTDIALRLELNGEQRQSASTDKLIYGVAELIAYASSVVTLEPGDVIATGTPAGVGPVEDGDVIRLSVTGVGDLTVRVSGEGATPYADRPGARMLSGEL